MAPSRGLSGRSHPAAAARPRRRRFWPVLLLVLPLVEILGIVAVGSWVGGGWTLLALLVAAIVGVLLVRREGRRSFGALRTASRTGTRVPVDLADSGLVLAAGVLLIVPGFLTDLLGLLLLVPAVRPATRVWMRTALTRRAMSHAAAHGVRFPPPGGSRPPRGPRPGPGAGRPGEDIIEGEILDEGPG